MNSDDDNNVKKDITHFTEQMGKKKTKELMDKLPNEMLMKILEYVDHVTLFKCGQVSREWRKVSESDRLWMQWYYNFFARQGTAYNKYKEEFKKCLNKLKYNARLFVMSPRSSNVESQEFKKHTKEHGECLLQ